MCCMPSQPPPSTLCPAGTNRRPPSLRFPKKNSHRGKGLLFSAMARGNQREMSREKNQKKLAAKNKGNDREGTPLSRNLNDKQALAAKVAAKKAAKEAEEAAASKAAAAGPAVVAKKKKKPKADAGLDDLLSAGLVGAKKKGK